MVWKERKTCPLCGSSQLIQKRTEKNNIHKDALVAEYLKDNVNLHECQDCSFGFVLRIPNDEQFYNRIYADGGRDVSIDFFYSGKKLIFRDIRNNILKYKKNGTLLDIGTGTGALLAFMKSDFAVQGIELSPASSAFARTQGLDVVSMDIEHLNFEDKKFDVVTIIDVLEHLPDPSGVVDEIKRILKSTGLVYIKVPNYPMQAWKQDLLRVFGISKMGIMQDYIHINHFTKKSLNLALVRSGFEVLEEGFTMPEIWDLRWKEAPQPLFRRVLRNVFSVWSAQFLNIFSKFLGRDLGFNLFILARKKE